MARPTGRNTSLMSSGSGSLPEPPPLLRYALRPAVLFMEFAWHQGER
jgi:hypothetical protein